ncbi:MAG: glycosyltransferase family 4 protein [Oscillochloris sp.]|nr:glycosyltransferase family 4 protein [Oscillochloris sp.]
MVRAIFLMEQHIGHQTYYENLHRFAKQEADLECRWVQITYRHGSKLLDLAPGLSNHVRGTLHGMLQVHKTLASAHYDVAFFNTQVPAALAINQVSRRPYVLATDITPIQYDTMGHLYGHQPDKGGLLAAYKYRVNTKLMQGAARILPWSHWTRDSLIHDYGVAPERIDVIPPGVDLQLWIPTEARHNSNRPLRILFVGGDLYRKGGATLLEAFRTLPRGSAEIHLVTRSHVAPEEGVHTYYSMQPNSAELISLYRMADVFVLPTEAEAFGIAVIEACAVGLAIITTAVGGLTDIVSDGETGFLIQPHDVARLSMLLRRLADDSELRTHVGRAARQKAETFFNAQRNAARVFEHIRAIANEISDKNSDTESLSNKHHQ